MKKSSNAPGTPLPSFLSRGAVSPAQAERVDPSAQPSTPILMTHARMRTFGGVSLLVGWLAPALLLGAAGCSKGGGGSAQNIPGQEIVKPDGSGTFFVDPNQGGGASRLHLSQMFWARVVDVHDIKCCNRRFLHAAHYQRRGKFPGTLRCRWGSCPSGADRCS